MQLPVTSWLAPKNVSFIDVGHLLGSSSIEIWVTESGTTTKLVFSGDIGNQHQPIIKDPTYLKDADYVFMESTYGDRCHGPKPDYVGELAKILQRTFDRGGNVVIPSFAVGRTQELLYFIREIKEKNLVTGHGCFPVYIDSPLAIEATRIFKDTDPSCFDEEANALLAEMMTLGTGSVLMARDSSLVTLTFRPGNWMGSMPLASRALASSSKQEWSVSLKMRVASMASGLSI